MNATRPPRGSVLLVEDEVMIRMMVADMLQELGYTIAAEAGEIADAIKVTAHPNSDVQLTERAGRLVTGSALKYGIAMNPTCMAPPHARFERILPKTGFDRFMNFVKFRLLEPILPGT